MRKEIKAMEDISSTKKLKKDIIVDVLQTLVSKQKTQVLKSASLWSLSICMKWLPSMLIASATLNLVQSWALLLLLKIFIFLPVFLLKWLLRTHVFVVLLLMLWRCVGFNLSFLYLKKVHWHLLLLVVLLFLSRELRRKINLATNFEIFRERRSFL